MKLFDFDRSISTNNICSHRLSDFVHLAIHLSPSNDPKIKIKKKLKSHRLPTSCHLFLYIKREMRDRERKKERREIKEVKTEIQPSQFQTAITFERKLRLRHATRP
jgi:hypothetical protein